MATSKALGNVFKLRNILDITDPRFGAKGDGVTDDSAAILAAIAAAEALGAGARGVTVYFPPGHNFVLSQLVTINTNFVELAGEGRGSLLTLKTNGRIRFGDASALRSFVGIRDLTISCASDFVAASVLFFNRCNYYFARGLFFAPFRNDVFHLGSASFAAPSGFIIGNVANPDSAGAGDFINVWGGGDLHVKHNQCQGIFGDDTAFIDFLAGPSQGDGFFISDNFCSEMDVGLRHVVASRIANVQVVGNFFDGCQGRNIAFAPTGAGNGAESILISDNVFTGGNDTGTNTDQANIEIIPQSSATVVGVTIANNVLKYANTHGMQFGSVTFLQITGNMITDFAKAGAAGIAGISIAASSTNLLITDNLISGTADTGISLAGQTTMANCIVANNSISTVTTQVQRSTALNPSPKIHTNGTTPDLPLAQAWVAFTVAGTTVTVEDSFNVTSVARNGVGDYTVTFIDAMDNENYTISPIAVDQVVWLANAPTTSSFRIRTGTTPAANVEATRVTCSVHGKRTIT